MIWGYHYFWNHPYTANNKGFGHSTGKRAKVTDFCQDTTTTTTHALSTTWNGKATWFLKSLRSYTCSMQKIFAKMAIAPLNSIINKPKWFGNKTANLFSNFRPPIPSSPPSFPSRFFMHFFTRRASQHPPMAKIRPFCTVDAPGPNSSTKSTSPGEMMGGTCWSIPWHYGHSTVSTKIITFFWRMSNHKK